MIKQRTDHTAVQQKSRYRRLGVILAGGVFLLTFMLYLRTLVPDVEAADSGEFQFVPFVLGIAHPPGYPLYTLVGKAFTMLPFGTVAFRMNVLSALFGAATVTFVYLAGVQLIQWTGRSGGRFTTIAYVNRLAALCGAALLACAATWWSQSTVASIRSFNGLFVAACLFLTANWAVTRQDRWLKWLAFTFGLSLTHHLTMWSLAPAFLVAILVVDANALTAPRRLVSLAWRAALPLPIFLYLPIRSAMGSPFDLAKPTTLQSFFSVITARSFSDVLFYFGWQDLPSRLDILGQLLLVQFGWLGLLLAIVGLAVTMLFSRKSALLLGLVLVGNAFVSLTYRSPQIPGYLIPTYIVVALFATLGAWSMFSIFNALFGRLPQAGRPVAVATAIAMLAVPGQSLVMNFTALDRHNDHSIRESAAAALKAAAPNSSILPDWSDSTPLWYLQLAESQRRDVDVRYAIRESTESPVVEVARQGLQRGPVYLTDYDRQIAPSFRLRPTGPLLQLSDEPDYADPATFVGDRYHPSSANFDNRLLLLGYSLESDSVLPGEKLRMTLYWKATEKPQQAYTVMVQIPAADGSVWGLQSGSPAKGHRPTTLWEAGEVVADERELVVAPDTPPGQYPLVASVYGMPESGQWRRLPLAAGGTAGSDLVPLQPITIAVRPEPSPKPNTVYLRLAIKWLLTHVPRGGKLRKGAGAVGRSGGSAVPVK